MHDMLTEIMLFLCPNCCELSCYVVAVTGMFVETVTVHVCFSDLFSVLFNNKQNDFLLSHALVLCSCTLCHSSHQKSHLINQVY